MTSSLRQRVGEAHMRRTLVVLLLVASTQPAVRAAQAAAPAGLRVSGNRIVDATGRDVRLIGVDRMGTEYACLYGELTDGPAQDATLRAMAAWGNVVRMP